MRNLGSVRSNVQGYARDSYLGAVAPVLSEEFPLIDCATGFAQWGLSPRAIQAHRDFDPTTLSAYPELTYDRLLKPAILEKFGVSGLSADQIFLGHGSFNLAERLIHKFIQPSRMIGPGPQFNEIPSEFVAAGGEYLPVPISQADYLFPLEELRRELNPRVSLLYIDNPNNPLGRLIGLREIEVLVQAAEASGTIVLIDEAYGDFVPDSFSAAHLVSRFNNLAVIRSFSKMLGLAAARVGYMFLSKELAAGYRPLDVPFEPSLYSATLASATIGDSGFIAGIRRSVAATKKTVVEKFLEFGVEVLPTHGVTSILTVRIQGDNLPEAFASVGVTIEPGSAFQKTHPGWDDSYCRVRVPNEESIASFCGRIEILANRHKAAQGGSHVDQR